MRRLQKNNAFTLTEIVLAMGIGSYALVSMLGLLSIGLNAGKSSWDQTVIAEASRQVMCRLRQKVQNAQGNLAGSELSATNLNAYSPIEEIYFDMNGMRLQDAGGNDLGQTEALGRLAVYRCTVDAIMMDPQIPGGGNADLLWSIRLTFQWPAGSANPPNKVTILASLANY